MQKVKWKKSWLSVLFGFLIVGVVHWNIYKSYRVITITEVCIDSPKVEKDFRYLFLSDLHENEFGDDNKRMYEEIRRLRPDFILVGGDIINWNSSNDKYAMDIVRELASIADVYFFLGNHEIAYMHFRGEIYITGRFIDDSSIILPEFHENSFIYKLKTAGAVFLQKEWKDIDINGNKVRIGGTYEAMFSSDEEHPEQSMQEGVYEFLLEYQDTDAVKLFVTHRPYSFLNGNASDLWDIDVIMSGHEHGGQVVIPGLGGFYSRERGLFPGKTQGAYLIGNTTFINSAGLGSYMEFLPRFNNPPELVLVTVK